MNKQAQVKLIWIGAILFLMLGTFIYVNAVGEEIGESVTESDNFNTTFEFSTNSISHKCLDISIQNLQDAPDQLNLQTILNETNFDVNEMKNLKFYEWKPEEVTLFNYTEVCYPYNETIINEIIINETNETITNETIVEYPNCTQIVVGNYTVEEWDWLERKLLTINKDGTVEVRNQWETSPIQKAGQVKDTNSYRLCFDVPIIKIENGWGNKGTIYLKLSSLNIPEPVVFYDKTHSSWWNSSLTYKRPLYFKTTSSSNIRIPYRINSSDGLSGSTIWTLPQESFSSATNYSEWLYYNDWTDMWVINYSENEQLPFDVENGTISSYNSQSVWSANSMPGVWHLDTALDSSQYLNNITWVGASSYAEGIFGNGRKFVGTNGVYGYIPYNSALDSANFSACIWINFTGLSNTNDPAGDWILYNFQYGSSVGQYGINRCHDANAVCPTSNLQWQVEGQNLDTDVIPTIGPWYFVCGTYDTTKNSSVYVNGEFKNSSILANPRTVGNTATNLHMSGRAQAAYYPTSAILDEMRYFNKTLTADEIKAIYQEGMLTYSILGAEETSGESNPPNVTINTPTNTTYNTNTIVFNVTATDDTLMDTCLYSLNSGVTNYTMSNSTFVDDYTHTNSTMSQGSQTVNFYCNDSSNNLNNTESVDFYIDSIKPYFTTIPSDVTLEYKTEGLSVDFDATDDGIGFDSYSINDTRFTINSSGYLDWTGQLEANNYFINVTINDTLNNINSTIYNLEITQNSSLVLGISGTTPITYGDTTDVAGSDCPDELTCSLDKTNQIYGAGTETFNYSTPGNTNYSASSITKAITINQAIPEGSLISDLGWTINETQEVVIGLTESQTGDADVTYIVYRDGISKSTGETWTPAYGTYDYVLNTTGGANWTANISMDIQTLTVNDNIFPQINLTYPTNTTYSTTQTAINYTYTETNCDSVWYSTDSGATNSTRVACGTNFTGLSSVEGSNTWTIYVNDSANNQNSSSVTFTTDLIPTITIQSPTNKSYSTSTIWFNATASETIDTWIVNYNGTNHTHSINTSLEVEDGSFQLLFYANDTTGNWGLNDSIYFTVDTTAPVITTSIPTGYEYGKLAEESYITKTINYLISELHEDTANYTLYYPNGTIWKQNLSAAYSSGSITMNLSVYGTYSLVIHANDTLNNIGSKTIYFDLDLVASGTPGSVGGVILLEDADFLTDASLLTAVPPTNLTLVEQFDNIMLNSESIFKKYWWLFIPLLFMIIGLTKRKPQVIVTKNK